MIERQKQPVSGVQAARRKGDARLALVRLAAALVIVASISLFIFGLASYNSGLRLPCPAWHPVDQAFCTQRLQSVQQLGITHDFFVSFEVVGIFIAMVPWIVLSLLIFWRRSSSMVEIHFAVALILFGTIVVDGGLLVSATYFHPELQRPVDFMNFLAASGLIIWFVFPDGRFVPRWTAVVAVVWVLRNVAWLFYARSPLDMGSWPSPVPQLVTTGFVAAIVYSLLYRYRHAANQIQRQQIKWVAVGALLFGPVAVARSFLDMSGTPAGTLTELVSGAFVWTLSLVFAIHLGVSILRYRLWDIDLIISRTLVYLPLTAIVAGIFAATIGLTQRFFIARTGSKSDIVTGIATLVTVALFDPIKTKIQKTVDAHFMEGSDPAAKLKAFGDAVENELGVLDPHRVAHRLLHEAVRAFDACSGAVYLGNDDHERLIHAHGAWKGTAHLTVPLQAEAVRIGRLELGERGNGAGYACRDQESLQKLAATVAQALARNDGWGAD